MHEAGAYHTGCTEGSDLLRDTGQCDTGERNNRKVGVITHMMQGVPQKTQDS